MSIWKNIMGLLPKKIVPESPQRMSSIGHQMLKDFEGISLKLYKDSAGHLTIGIGHKLNDFELKSGIIQINGELVHVKYGITEHQAMMLKRQDLELFENILAKLVKVPLTQNQFDALVSLVFNIGAWAFSKSTLLKRINEGRMAEVPSEFKKWNKVTLPNGEKIVSNGLRTRRKKEAALWSSHEGIVQPAPKLKA